MRNYKSYESVNIINGQVGDPRRNVIKRTTHPVFGVTKPPEGGYRIGQLNIDKQNIDITSPRGSVKIKDGNIDITSPQGNISIKGHKFNNGNTGIPPSDLAQKIMDFVNNLLKSIFGTT